MSLRASLRDLRGLGLALTVAGASIAASSVVACRDGDDTGSGEDHATSLDQADWLEKTARLLRNGEGLGPRDDVDALLAMPKEAAVDKLMEDPRFGDMVLGFNLYFLGRSVDRVKTPDGRGGFRYDRMAFAWPQALASAKAVVEGGNYFELWSGAPPLYLPRLTEDFGDQGDSGAPNRPLIRLDPDAAATVFDVARNTVLTNRAAGCLVFTTMLEEVGEAFQIIDFELSGRLARWSTPLDKTGTPVECTNPALSNEEVTTWIGNVRGAADQLLRSVVGRKPTAVRSIADIPTVFRSVEGLPPLVEPLSAEGFWNQLPSTSTNFHRKRAAYVLKTYLCDDLTPLSIPEAGDGGDAPAGGDGRHASDPNCQACHYRLDPIGALFRNRGSRGLDGSARRSIFFDDGVDFSGEAFDKYLGEWRLPDGSFKAGRYVIGADGKPTRDPAWLDADGDKLEGLWAFLGRSETAKSCLVRRLAEYVLGPKQVYDREWLRQLAREAKLKNAKDSGTGFKKMVKSLVLSNTFSTQDPKPGTCYDGPPNASPNRPPCAVAHIVANQCADCHGSVAARGHIDLTAFVQGADGTFGWRHEDENGKELKRADSFKRILERLTTPDKDKRMPLQRALEGDELTTLKTWLEQNMNSPQPTGPTQ